MENKKPISKIIKLGKVREFALTDSQSQDPKFDIELGDTVTITVVGKVIRSADAGENLFTFSREFAVNAEYSFLSNVKKYEAEEKEAAIEEASEVEIVSQRKRSKVH